MNKQICLLLALLAVAYTAVPTTWSDATTYPTEDTTKDSAIGLALKYGADTVDNSIIHFKLTATSEAWVALGFASGASMANIDVALFTADNSNVVSVEDRWGTTTAQPVSDTTDDLTLGTASYASGAWDIEWSRKLVSDDTTQDLNIYCGDNAVAFATGTDQTFTVHTYIQFANVNISDTDFTCTDAPDGYRDWLDTSGGHSSHEHDDDDDDGEDDGENATILQLALSAIAFLALLF